MEGDFAALGDEFEDILLSEQDKHLKEIGPFRPLDLPPEIWLTICEYATLRSDVKPKEGAWIRYSEKLNRLPAIAQTCRALRYATIQMIQRRNEVFYAHSPFVTVPCNCYRRSTSSCLFH